MKYKVHVTVKEQQGICQAEHKVGDVIEFSGAIPNGGICSAALMALYHDIFSIMYGVELPWAKDNKVLVACPDATNPVIFEVERREKIKD